jgi:hypothetical protein
MLDKIVNTQSKGALPIGANLCLPEEPVYPSEFLNIIKDTGFEALQECLKKIDAPEEALGLLEDLVILTTIGDLQNGDKVSSVTNQILMETVASASRNITGIGGIFYGPSGTTISREGGANIQISK